MLNVQEFNDPRPYVVIEQFLSDNELKAVWTEITNTKDKLHQGTYQINYVDAVRPDIKKNVGYTVNDLSPNIEDSVIRMLLYAKLVFCDNMIKKMLTLNCPVFQLLRLTKSDTTRVSAYASGDFYNWHTDQSVNGLLTALLMLCREPRGFKGGDLEFEWKGTIKSVPFCSNRLVIFARNTPHRVTPIVCKDESFESRRISIQFFADV